MNTISNSENFFARHFVFPYRSSHQRCSIKQMFLRISQNSQDSHSHFTFTIQSTCARASFLIKLKKRLWHSCFSVNFGKFLWTSFLQNTSGRLLLYLIFKFKKSFLCYCPYRPYDIVGAGVTIARPFFAW